MITSNQRLHMAQRSEDFGINDRLQVIARFWKHLKFTISGLITPWHEVWKLDGIRNSHLQFCRFEHFTNNEKQDSVHRKAPNILPPYTCCTGLVALLIFSYGFYCHEEWIEMTSALESKISVLLHFPREAVCHWNDSKSVDLDYRYFIHLLRLMPLGIGRSGTAQRACLGPSLFSAAYFCFFTF